MTRSQALRALRATVLAAVAAMATAAAPAEAAAAVISEAPFQTYVQLTCQNASCYGRLPVRPAKQRLEIRFVSCVADTGLGAKLDTFLLQVSDAAITRQLMLHYIAPQYQSPAEPFHYVASQPMLLAVEPNTILHLAARAIGGVIVNVGCGLSGVRQTLS